MNDEFDEPWKEILDSLLEFALLLFHPSLHSRIDWSRGYESLEQELHRVAPQGESTGMGVDKLFKVWQRDGEERWLLIHVEVQSQRREDFARRMFRYNTAIFLAFDVMPISIAILGDDRPNWQPDHFALEEEDTRIDFRFRAVKLLGYRGREEELRNSDNPFAVVVAAHLATLRTHSDKAERGEVKFTLARQLLSRGFSKETTEGVFRFLDWVMKLPDDINRIWWANVTALQKGTQVPFESMLDRYKREIQDVARREAIQKGRQEGRQGVVKRQLGLRFGEAGARLAPRVEVLSDEAKLDEIADLIALGNSLDEIESRLPRS